MTAVDNTLAARRRAQAMGPGPEILMGRILSAIAESGTVPAEEVGRLVPDWPAARLDDALGALRGLGGGVAVLLKDRWGYYVKPAREQFDRHWVEVARARWCKVSQHARDKHGRLRKYYACECGLPVTRERWCSCGLEIWAHRIAPGVSGFGGGLPRCPWLIHEGYGELLGGRASVGDPYPDYVDDHATDTRRGERIEDDAEYVEVQVHNRPSTKAPPMWANKKKIKGRKKPGGKSRASPKQGRSHLKGARS